MEQDIMETTIEETSSQLNNRHLSDTLFQLVRLRRELDTLIHLDPQDSDHPPVEEQGLDMCAAVCQVQGPV